jgi:hypothetical protein
VKLKKLNPKQVRQGYDKGYVDGYNAAIDDLDEERLPRELPQVDPLPRPSLDLKESRG